MGYRHLVKKCGDCQKIKSVDDFYKDRKGTRGRDGYCRKCRRRRDRKRTADKNSHYHRKKASDPFYFRNLKLKSLYGISHKKWLKMYKRQGGSCAICRGTEKRILYGQVTGLVVDHDHITGKVRSLLCFKCNAKLAAVEDDQFCLLARNYLRCHGSTLTKETKCVKSLYRQK